MGNKIFSDILNLKQDKVIVSFKPDGQPTLFSKSVQDDRIEFVNQNNLVDSSFAENPIQSGGKRKSIRRTNKKKTRRRRTKRSSIRRSIRRRTNKKRTN
jgi:hypothetical protein